MTLKVKLAAILLAGTLALPAGAATISFTGANGGDGVGYTEAGFTFDEARIVSGNCDSVSGAACMGLNKNDISTLKSATDGALFSLTSFWFQLLGASPSELTVSSSKGGTLILTESNYGNNDGGHTYTLAGNALFDNVEWLTFSDSGTGNVRVDDITVATVPIPAAGLLLLGGLGGLAALRRQRKAA